MRETLVLALFACCFAGTLVEIVLMLGHKRRGGGLVRFRLIFFFMVSLMLVSLLSIWFFARLSTAIWIGGLGVVLVNLVGIALTYVRPASSGVAEVEEEGRGVRAYVLYYQGKKLGVVTRAGFEQLQSNDLLKKQRTVELVDDYQQRARRQGLEVLIYENKDSSQRLVKVEAKGGAATAS